MVRKKIDNSGILHNLTNGGEGAVTDQWSEERKKSIRGENNSFYGKHHSEEAKKLIGNRDYSCQSKDSHYDAKKVCIDGTVYPTVREAAKVIGKHENTLRGYLKGRRKSPFKDLEMYYVNDDPQ